MLGFNKHNVQKSAQTLINLRPLNRVKLKGAWVPEFLISFEGFWDHHLKMIHSEEIVAEKNEKEITYMRARSSYLSKAQSRYDQYVATLYEKGGAVLKKALIERERVNDQIYLLSKELARAEKLLPEDPGVLFEDYSVEQRRSIATAKRTIQKTEQETADKVSELKDIKMQLDEAIHAIEEMLIQKRNVVTRQKCAYFKGARFVAMTDEFVAENKESQAKFDQLINRDFKYCIDLEQLICRDEKESDDHERI